jgi:uncharacterized glyoxalase superfamily protein PhnB
MNGSLKPNLGYRDAPAVIRFLISAFGFEEVVIYHGANSDAIGHAELRWPGGGSLTLHTAAPSTSIARLTSLESASGDYPAFSVHIDTGEPDALFARAVAAGAKVIRPVEDSPMGTRGFVVADPEGLYWSFGTPLPELPRDERGRWRPKQ